MFYTYWFFNITLYALLEYWTQWAPNMWHAWWGCLTDNKALFLWQPPLICFHFLESGAHIYWIGINLWNLSFFMQKRKFCILLMHELWLINKDNTQWFLLTKLIHLQYCKFLHFYYYRCFSMVFYFFISVLSEKPNMNPLLSTKRNDSLLK